jgi:hypothetical protein
VAWARRADAHEEQNMKRYTKLLTALLSLLTIASLVLGVRSAGAQDRQSRLIWAQVAGVPADVTLNDVFMVNQDRAWAVGKQGNLGVSYNLNLQNGRWVASPGPTFDYGGGLNSVVVAPSGTIWMVGDNGLIAHSLTRGAWAPEQPLPGVSLQTIQILGNDERRWVGGYIDRSDSQGEPVMLRSDGGAWGRDPDVGGEGRIYDLHFAPGGGWAVGLDQIWRYTNGRWSSEEEPEPCGEPGCGSSLMAVRAITSDEAWAFGSRNAFCAICVARPYAIHRDGGRWQVVQPNAGIGGWQPDQSLPAASSFSDATFLDRENGFAAGSWIDRANMRGPIPLIVKYERGTWTYMDSPQVQTNLTAVSAIDTTHALAVGDGGVILAYGYGPQGQQNPNPAPFPPTGNPTARVNDPHLAGVSYFPETGHTLRGEFQNYWRANGGLAQFGFPVTEEYSEVNPDDGKTYLVQYFERARFEYHPEFAGTRYAVLLGLLGRTVTAHRANEGPFQPVGPSNVPGSRYYRETGHNLAPQFISRWDRTGGLPVYGFPITDAFYEVSPTDGKTYLVQYFERNRFEYHPELAGTPYEVLLGLLGSEVLRSRGWLP